jgi:type IV pilus assembly protein PilM
MGIFSSTSEFFGLDIDTTAIRVVQMRSGRVKVVEHYGYLEIDQKMSKSDSNTDRQHLAQAIKKVISDAGISTPNVAVGLPSQKVFMTVVDVERLSPQELDQSIRLQADSLIPTPISESKIDWALLGDSPKEASKVELLLSSVSNDYVEKQLDMLESLGLNVIAFEPDSLAIARALLAPGSQAPNLVLDMGDVTTDLIITVNDGPRLIRSIPVGMEAVIKSAMQNLNVDEKQARQFVFKFGISKDKLEGQVHNAIIGPLDMLINEIEKSIKFFNTRYIDKKIELIIVTGGASTLPEFPLHIANHFGVAVEVGNAWRNATIAAEKQNELLTLSHQFSVAAGLAERSI